MQTIVVNTMFIPHGWAYSDWGLRHYKYTHLLFNMQVLFELLFKNISSFSKSS